MTSLKPDALSCALEQIMIIFGLLVAMYMPTFEQCSKPVDWAYIMIAYDFLEDRGVILGNI